MINLTNEKIIISIKNEINDAKFEYSSNQRIENLKNATLILGQSIRNKNQREIFEIVQSEKYWKFSTKPVKVLSEMTANKILDAITYFVGGAEIDKVADNVFVITSKGYYYYIGA